MAANITMQAANKTRLTIPIITKSIKQKKKLRKYVEFVMKKN